MNQKSDFHSQATFTVCSVSTARKAASSAGISGISEETGEPVHYLGVTGSVQVFLDEYTWESMLPRLATLPAWDDCLRCFGVALSEIALTALPGYWIFRKAELP